MIKAHGHLPDLLQVSRLTFWQLANVGIGLDDYGNEVPEFAVILARLSEFDWDRMSAVANLVAPFNAYIESWNEWFDNASVRLRELAGGITPADERTKPMSYRQAARYMGKGNSQDAAEWLSKCVRDGTIRCRHLSRQSHVYSIRDFPQTVRSQILPNSPPTQPKPT